MFVFIETLSARLFARLWCNSPELNSGGSDALLVFVYSIKALYINFSELFEALTDSIAYRIIMFEF